MSNQNKPEAEQGAGRIPEPSQTSQPMGTTGTSGNCNGDGTGGGDSHDDGKSGRLLQDDTAQ